MPIISHHLLIQFLSKERLLKGRFQILLTTYRNTILGIQPCETNRPEHSMMSFTKKKKKTFFNENGKLQNNVPVTHWMSPIHFFPLGCR